MVKMRDTDDLKNQVGEEEGGGKTTLAWGGTYMNGEKAQSLGTTRISDSRAAGRQQRNRPSRRWGDPREKSLMSKLVTAAATLAILLSSLVAIRFIACFEAVSLHRLARRTFPGGTARRLAGGYELIDLIPVGQGGGHSPTGGLQEALASCPEGTDELLMVLLPADSYHSSEDLQRPHRQAPGWWKSSTLRVSPYVLMLLFFVVAMACGLVRATLASVAQSTAPPLGYATYGFLGLAVAAAVAVISIETQRLPSNVTALEKALLVVPSLLSAVAVAFVVAMHLYRGPSTESSPPSVVYGFLGLAGLADAGVIALSIWRVVVYQSSRPQRTAPPATPSEDERSSGDEAGLTHHRRTGSKISAAEKALVVWMSLLFLVALGCVLAMIIKRGTGQTTRTSPLSYATVVTGVLSGVTAVAVIGIQIWKLVASYRHQSRSEGDGVPLIRLLGGRSRERSRRRHQEAPAFRFSAGEKALLVLRLVLLGVAVVWELVTLLLKGKNTLDAVTYPTYGFAGVAVVGAAVVFGIVASRLHASRRRRLAGSAWV